MLRGLEIHKEQFGVHSLGMIWESIDEAMVAEVQRH